MTDFIYRFSFHLPDRKTLESTRASFGALLKKLNLRYRSEKEFLFYKLPAHSDEYLWEMRFLILPPECQPDTYSKSLRYLNESGFQEYRNLHPGTGDVTIYRNLDNFPTSQREVRLAIRACSAL